MKVRSYLTLDITKSYQIPPPKSVRLKEGNQNAEEMVGSHFLALSVTDCSTHFNRQMGPRNNVYLLPNK